MARKRYRYITNGTVVGSNPICDFRLLGANNITKPYDGAIALRVVIPDDLVLEKWSCDPYSTTDDKRTLDELGYDVMIWSFKTSKWTIHNELKGTRPCDVPIHYRRDLNGL